ncbi:hypothetical protein GA0070622_2725 [Micromonospora sediminicola]|uniref:Thioesterase domain-containing protein n=1 Tax=Micromonospora sediminicola TaxID=946078 RepID=A0A1A9B860_9ACTN|nr:hypothetical protein [Micromonospora sediminicola]SBT65720.1 hypothetical protein GA0070622_2725 [Micromonospora sediminicola]
MSELLLLVLDYPGRRTEARVADLGLEHAGFAVRYLLREPFVREPTAPRYAEELLAQTPVDGPCAGVLAYCMAASIAQEVASRVSAAAEPTALILFDGEPASPAAIEEQFDVTARQLAAQLGGMPPQASDASVFDPARLAGHPEDVIAAMRHTLVELGVSAVGEGDDDPYARDTAEDLADFYLDWLVHLVAANNASWPAWGGEVLHVMSRDHGFAGPWPGAATTRHVRCGVPRPELLRHPEVLPTVRAFLDSRVPSVRRRA